MWSSRLCGLVLFGVGKPYSLAISCATLTRRRWSNRRSSCSCVSLHCRPITVRLQAHFQVADQDKLRGRETRSRLLRPFSRCAYVGSVAWKGLAFQGQRLETPHKRLG